MTESSNIGPLLAQTVDAANETAAVDFKASLDVDNKGQWLEVLKDLVAMANSGGGLILIGLDDAGIPTGFDVAPILNYDVSRIGDKLRKYTGVHFGGVALLSVPRGRFQLAEIQVSTSAIPLVFTADGQYLNEHNQERFAFRQGTVYFRHGAKSEPGTSDDLRSFVERQVELVKTSWLSGIRQVVEAPPGAVVSVGLPIRATAENTLDRVRLVADADAVGVVLMDPNKTHPYRLKEVVSEVNRWLGGGTHISVHDILGIRRLYQTDANRSYRYKPNTGSGQYSDAFVQWIVNQLKADANFLIQLRERHHEWVINHNGRAREVAPPVVDRGNRLLQEAN